MNTSKFFKPLLLPSIPNIASLLLVFFSLCILPAHAQSGVIMNSDTNEEAISKSQQDNWITFPYTIQVSGYLGFTNKIPQLLRPEDTRKKYQYLPIEGMSIDVGVLQIRRFFCKHFLFYPKLGLSIDYGWLENKGSLMGCFTYLEPQYNYLARWEVFPSLGIGIVYVSIPGFNFKKLNTEEQGAAERSNASDFVGDFYRQGLHLNLAFALRANIRLTPRWQLSPGIGFSYLPVLEKEERGPQQSTSPQRDSTLKTVTASVTLGYTPNPILVHYYPRLGQDKKSRVDISWLSSFRKPESLRINNQPIHTNEDNYYYYVGGIYGQWSLHCIGSHAFTLGTEWIWDGASEQVLKNTYMNSALKISLLTGHEFRWGKLLFGQQIGYYPVNNCAFHPLMRLYVKLGIDYKVTDFLLVGASLRTGGIRDIRRIDLQTDFIDLRIGYSF